MTNVAVISGTFHDLIASSHVGRAQRTCLTCLLAQGTWRAEPVNAAVADRRTADVLGLADVGADATLTAEADRGTEDEEQRVAEA